MPNLTHVFKYKGKEVPVGKFDPSEPDTILDVKWTNSFMTQHLFDQLEDSEVFTDEELEKLTHFSRKKMKSKLRKIKPQE
jgi:hypothetical protein